MRALNNDALVLLLVVGAGMYAYFKGWVSIIGLMCAMLAAVTVFRREGHRAGYGDGYSEGFEAGLHKAFRYLGRGSDRNEPDGHRHPT